MSNVLNQGGATDGPSHETLLEIYRRAALIRRCGARFLAVIMSGRIAAPYYSPRGQEILAAAMAVNLRPEDYAVTIYRGLHDHLAKGVPLKELWAEYAGKASGACKGKGGPMHITHPASGVVVTTGIVGSGIPIANGLALASQIRGDGRVTMTSFGDGATNTGSFHEAANMAALWDLPLVLLCQNNLYAEMTPTSDTMKLEHVAERAAGYGMPGVRVDGNDPLAVKSALDEALQRARTGGGPTFLECVTFRFRGHYFGDRMPYIPKAQLEAAMAADPVPKFRDHLIATGTCASDELDRIDNQALATVERALGIVMSADAPSIDELDRDVYATPIKFPV